MKRTKKADRLAHVELWRSSGISRAAYCRQHGLKYAAFLSWFKLEVPTLTSGKFITLSEKGVPSEVISISFPNGIQLDYKGKLTESLIQYLHDA